jgi:dipeptidyl aminopeptidase/acylaminoacyl peptidase
VDVDDVVTIGARRRPVGVRYVTDAPEVHYFDPEDDKLVRSLGKALPTLPTIALIDASRDEKQVLVRASSDQDPGRYYVFDRTRGALNEIMLARPELEGATLSPVQSVTYTTADGTKVPAYLTLPPGSDGKNLPGIVMPHGGPAERTEWGFDWLSQFFANRGYAVLQPNFRGSTGYGEEWLLENGFRSWQTAIGDVNDAARWLAREGIAAPGRLAIVGWSYGGYAALQANVLDPGLYRAAIAIAPVTDLAKFKEEYRGFTNYGLAREYIGSGSGLAAGSPALDAGTFKAPVLLFHGELDRAVGVQQSRRMHAALRAAGKPSELVAYPDLEHDLADSTVRADLLRRSERFLAAVMGDVER